MYCADCTDYTYNITSIFGPSPKSESRLLRKQAEEKEEVKEEDEDEKEDWGVGDRDNNERD